MTAALDVREDLRVLTDIQLAQVYSDVADPDRPAALAEASRRDRATAARAAARSRFSEWEDAARANFEAAEAYCRGDDNMLNARGRARGMTAWDLWHGDAGLARRYASDDLLNFWDWQQPRTPGPREYVNAATPPAGDDEIPQGAAGACPGDVTPRGTGTMGLAGYAARTAVREGVRYANQPRHPGTVAVPRQGTVVRPGAAQDEAAEEDNRPVDGALLWLLVRRYLSYYVAFPSTASLDMVTAWVFHACARNRDATGMGQLIWNATPRLLILSRKAGAGKSTLLDLIVILTGSRRGKVPRITPARLAQITGQAYETVCIDEGRLVFGAGARHQDLQACLLAGYTPGASYEVSKTSLDLFGSAAIAAKESLITEATKAVGGNESSLGDLVERCFSVILAAPEHPMPEVGQRARAEGAALARGLVKWTNDNRDTLTQAAQDIADEDYDAATLAAERGERAARTPRALQIGRALRAIGRGIDTQVLAEQRARGIHGDGPQCEAIVLAALSGGASGASGGVMTELEALRETWEGRPEDEEEPGRIVYDGAGSDVTSGSEEDAG